MTPLYEQDWLIRLVAFLRGFPWFEKWIWGKSVSMEDFVRNPAEVLRDNCLPFCFKGIVPVSSLLIRIGFIRFSPDRMLEYRRELMESGHPGAVLAADLCYKPIPTGVSIFNRSLGLCNPWTTKYPNAAFMFQVAFSFWLYVIPIPFIALVVRYSREAYFQFGLGWAPQRADYDGSKPGDNTFNAVLCGKLRIAGYSKEAEWNPGGEVYGYWEGAA